MASACVNNNVGLLFDSPTKSYDWFNPRSSSPPSSPPQEAKTVGVEVKAKSSTHSKSSENLIDLGFSDDFEFRIEEDPVKIKMISADELFADGKLMPLHVSTARLSVSSSEENGSSGACSVEEILKSRDSSSVSKISSGMDPYLFSPKAPRCSSGWRELLGLKKLQQTAAAAASSSSSSRSAAVRSLKQFGHKTPKKSDHTLGQPLLSELESEIEKSELCDAISPGRDLDLPRISLDSHKSSTRKNHHNQNHPHPHPHPPKVRLVRRVPDPNHSNSQSSTHQSTQSSSVSASQSALGVSIDSPRMNSSGKVVFQSLERSSSSPSTFNGGPRVKYKGMERRSYSANVKVSPVLNVPVCSLRGSSKFGLGQLFPSPHKKSSETSERKKSSDSERIRNGNGNGNVHQHHHSNKQKQPLS